jgi:hypothetical protein
MKKALFGIAQETTGKLLFEYKTYQGNRKKAIFTSEKYAQEAIDKYIKDAYRLNNFKWRVVCIGEIFEK